MSLLDKLRRLLDSDIPVSGMDLDSFYDTPRAVERHGRAIIKRAYQSGGPSANDIDVTSEFLAAVRAIEAGVPAVFVTGKAGTGKSTFIRYLQNLRNWAMVTAAPTGIAALNCRGQTIHSLFSLPGRMISASEIRASARNQMLFEKLELLVIDEASMMRADLVDIVDQCLKKWRRSTEPFGGVQVLFVGDLLQLPPVVTEQEQEALLRRYRTPWFFSAEVVRELDRRGQFVTLELTKVFRQADPVFVEVLNRIRMNDDHRESVGLINRTCYRPDDPLETDLMLVATNRQADAINAKHLASLPGTPQTYQAIVEGEFKVDRRRMPAPEQLVLKEGARVMVVKNTGGAVNGTIGTVVEMTGDTVTVAPLRNHRSQGHITLGREDWDQVEYEWVERSGEIESRVVGRYKQVPICLAAAVTIHKAQGMTLDSVGLDLGQGAFADGQTYVALSRVKSIAGLRLVRPIRMQDVRADEAVVAFYRRHAESRKNATS